MLLHSFNRLIPFFYVHSSFLISIRHLTSRSSSHHLLLSLSFIRSCATLRVGARLYALVRDFARWCATLRGWCATLRVGARLSALVRDFTRWCATLRVGARLCAFARDFKRWCAALRRSYAP